MTVTGAAGCPFRPEGDVRTLASVRRLQVCLLPSEPLSPIVGAIIMFLHFQTPAAALEAEQAWFSFPHMRDLPARASPTMRWIFENVSATGGT